MADINKKLKDIANLRRRITNDLAELTSLSLETSVDLNKRFKDETSRTTDLESLQDFKTLNDILRRNAMDAKGARALVSRMRSTDGYEISEEQTDELDKLLNQDGMKKEATNAL